MTIHVELLSHDELYSQLHRPPAFVNDFNVMDVEEQKRLNALLYTKYDGDSLSSIPSCECGHTTTERRVGKICEVCGTEVVLASERPIESGLWMRVPDGIPAFVNPQAWMMMRIHLNIGPVNFLHWLTDRHYKPKSISKELNRLMSNYPIERGYNFFVENFDKIIQALYDCRCIKGTRQDREDFMAWVYMYRHTFFSTVMPIPSKVGFVTENTPMGIYTDLNMTLATNAVRTLSSIVWSVTPQRDSTKQNKIIKVINQMADYYLAFYRKSLNPKEALFRKQYYGGRTDFSCRAVITSISEPHNYQEIFLPWQLSVMMFKEHILSKLLRRQHPEHPRKYTQQEAMRLYSRSISSYNETIDEILQDLIAKAQEFGYYGIPAILQRNPSLKFQSAQQVFISKIKTDVDDNTFGMSTLILKGPNADKVILIIYLPMGDEDERKFYISWLF